MRGRASAGLALALAGALFGCQKPLAEVLQGDFAFSSTGESASFLSLAEKKSTESPTRISLAASGIFTADAGTGTLALAQVQLFDRSESPPAALFGKPESWTIRVDAEGFEADRELTPEMAWISKAMASYWSPRFPAAGKHQVTEFDGLNTVHVEAKGRRVVRTWLQLAGETADLADLPNREAIPVEAAVSGELAYSGDAKYPNRIEGTKKTIQRIGRRKVGESSLTISIRQKLSKASPPAFRPVARHRLLDASQAAKNERALQQKYRGKATLSELLAAADKPADSEARNATYLALRALFYLEPGQSAVAAQAAKSPRQLDLVAEALVGAGNEPALAAFTTILRDSQEEALPNRLALAIPLTHWNAPLSSFIEELAFGSSASASIRDMAQLVVGSNIRRCLGVNPGQADRLSSRLVKALTEAASEDDRHNLLFAIGNAGNPAMRTLQSAYLKSESAVLRRAAVHSLRHLVDANTRAALKAMLETETDLQVRAKIEEILDLG